MPSLTMKAVCIHPNGPERPKGHKVGEYGLFGRQGNIKGFSVEQFVRSATKQDHFQVWKAFLDDVPPQATEILIRSGRGQVFMEGMRHVCFTDREHWELNDLEEILRVKDAVGKVVGEYRIQANRCDILPAAPVAAIGGIIRPAAAAGIAFGEVS